jgi:hypothetical protein
MTFDHEQLPINDNIWWSCCSRVRNDPRSKNDYLYIFGAAVPAVFLYLSTTV